MHNNLAIAKILDVSMRERIVVANLALHSLASIDDISRETLEYIKQEDAVAFQIAMITARNLFK
jgi:hypothetical protein